MGTKLFISYRREDSAGYAGRVYDRLEREFSRDLLVMDVDSIPLGANFIKVIGEEVAKCDVLLAIIGPGWLDARDEDGKRRLEDIDDFVRVEIATALTRGILVIPILLEGARIPKANQLPDDLKELSVRNGLNVRHASFFDDMERLIRGLAAGRRKKDFASTIFPGPSSGPATQLDSTPEPKPQPVVQSGTMATGAEGLVKETTTQSFVKDVIEESKRQPVLIDFWAPWCGPCKQLTPVLEKVVRTAKGKVKLVKMNIDEHPAIPGQMGIQSIPAVIAFVNGQPADGFMGALSESQVTAFIERLTKDRLGGTA